MTAPDARPGTDTAGSADAAERPAGPRHEAIREHLAARGASFYRELFGADNAHGFQSRWRTALAAFRLQAARLLDDGRRQPACRVGQKVTKLAKACAVYMWRACD